MVVIIFAAAFGTLAISFWTYMIPLFITIDEAAAPQFSLVERREAHCGPAVSRVR
jgi:cytochrome d ubiquinol oxidase subunit II